MSNEQPTPTSSNQPSEGGPTPTSNGQPSLTSNGQPTPNPLPATSRPHQPTYATIPVQQPRQPGGFKRGFGLGAGAGLGVGTAFLVLGLVGTLMSALMMIGMAGMLSGVKQTSIEPLKTVWGAETAAKTLRAVLISGPIMADASDGALLSTGTYGYEVAQGIDKLQAKDADGLVLLVNTPGGSINGARAIADAVKRYQSRTGKKVFAYVQGMSASGGMYAMAGVDKITADHGSLVGSIGIIAGPFERYKDVTAITGSMLTSGVVTSGGITSEYLTQGTDKDFGSPWRDMTPQERAVFMRGLANEYDNFVNWVATNRKIPAETIKGSYGAHIFDTKTAQENKLIDATMGRDEAFRDFATVAGLDPAQTRLVQPEAPNMFAQLFGAQARVFGQSAPAASLGGQAPRATASLCAGTPTILAYQGSLVGVCR